MKVKLPMGLACIALSACSSGLDTTAGQPEAQGLSYSEMEPLNQARSEVVDSRIYALRVNEGRTAIIAGGIATDTQLASEVLPSLNLDGLNPTGSTADGIEYYDVDYTPLGADEAINLRVFTTGFSNGSLKTAAISFDVEDSYVGRRVFSEGDINFTDLTSEITGPVAYRGVTEAGTNGNGAVLLQIDDINTGVGTLTYEDNTLAVRGIISPTAIPSWTTLKTDVLIDPSSGYFSGSNSAAVIKDGVPQTFPMYLETHGSIVGDGSEMIGVLTASGISDGAGTFNVLKAYVGKPFQ